MKVLALFEIFLLPGIFTLAAPALFGATNSVTITELAGISQNSRPFIISRVFSRGEITGYARPSVGGTSLSAWQCDVKTRYSDGSLKHGIISFTTTLRSNASVVVSFVSSVNPSSAGDKTATAAAALTAASMLSFNSGAWGAQMQVSQASATRSPSARQMLRDGNFRFWLQGPIVTQVIAEDRTPARTYDFGWRCSSNCNGDYSAATWANDNTNRSLHPIFVLTFSDGWAGVKEDFILENSWNGFLQDQRYKVTLLSGPNGGKAQYTSVGNSTADGFGFIPHYAMARWRKTFWDGSAPGAVKIDLNLPYMIASKVIPNYDTSLSVSRAAITSDVSEFKASDQGDINGHATWYKDFGTTGGRPDIGVFPTQYVRYLFTFDPNELNVVLLSANAAASVPIHWREADTSKYYDAEHTISAFGRPMSVDARPTDRLGYSGFPNAPSPLSTSHKWNYMTSHLPNFSFIPYLVSGDWFYLEEMQLYAAWSIGALHPGDASWNRKASWGFISNDVETRGQAWGWRDLGQTAFASPDGTPEQSYFLGKMNNNAAVMEGFYNITGGGAIQLAQRPRTTPERKLVSGVGDGVRLQLMEPIRSGILTTADLSLLTCRL